MTSYPIRAEARQEQHTTVAEDTLTLVEVGPWLDKTYRTVSDVLAAHGIAPVGPPFARYRAVEGGETVVEAGFPVAVPVPPEGEVYASTLPGGPVAVTLHVGPYDAVEPVYERLACWVREQGAHLVGDAWEVYLTDPDGTDPSTLQTEVVQPYLPA